MPIQTNFGAFIDGYRKNEIINFENPNCNNCNECCSMLTLLTKDEFLNIRRFLLHNAKGWLIYKKTMENIRHNMSKGVVNLMCPFTDSNKRCQINFIKPSICREFHCDPELNKVTEENKMNGRMITIAELFFPKEDNPWVSR